MMSNQEQLALGTMQVSRRTFVVLGAAALGVAGTLGKFSRGALAESSTSSASPKAPPAARMTKLNLNTATEEAFRSIPGVGDRMLGEFDEYQPYRSILQFRKEIGKYVDEKQVVEFEKYVYVPIDPNKADKETLMQLPSVHKAIAQELIDGRPYDDNAAFLAALEKLVSKKDVATAEAYLVEAS